VGKIIARPATSCLFKLVVFSQLFFVVAVCPVRAEGGGSPTATVAHVLSATLNYADAKIALDRAVAPSADYRRVLREIERLAEQARLLAGPRASEGAKIDAVRKVLTVAGPWNDHRPFSYDQDDPLGQNVRNKLLSVYFETRRGNCVTMPTLFLIIAQQLGLNVSLTTAPLHVLVRYTHTGIHPFNIEATSGGNFARDEWYRQNWPMSDRAIESGLYLRTHSQRETVAVMATTVLEFLLKAGRNEEAIAVADTILKANPLDGFVMVKKGTAIANIMKMEFFDKYPSPSRLPPAQRERYLALAAANKKAFEDAEALGWQPSPG
jgi:regulator of sirC expression with transglutaminase-like and TPR domain